MHRQPIVGVRSNTMVLFARLFKGIYMDRGSGKIRQMMKQLMVYLFGNRVPFRHGQLRVYRAVEDGLSSSAPRLRAATSSHATSGRMFATLLFCPPGCII